MIHEHDIRLPNTLNFVMFNIWILNDKLLKMIDPA